MSEPSEPSKKLLDDAHDFCVIDCGGYPMPESVARFAHEHAEREAAKEREKIPTRVQPDSECTADPIYLLQSKRYVVTNIDRCTYDSDAEEIRDSEGAVVTEEQMHKAGDEEVIWETEAVFFTREEADDFGRSHAYRWRNGWRSYSIPTIGTLRDLLRMLTTRETP